MPRTPKRNSERPETLDVLDSIGTLEDYFEELKKGNVEILKFKKEREKEIVKAQSEEMKKAIKEWAKEEEELRKLGVKNLEEYKKKILEKNRKEEAKKTLEELKKVFDIRTNYEKRFGVDSKLIDERQSNRELIASLNALEESTGKLTKEQEKMRDEAKKNLDKGNKELTKKLGLEALGKSLSALTNAINSNIDTYSKYQGGINARLQGANIYRGLLGRTKYGENRFGLLENRLSLAIGVSPYVKQEELLNNLQSLVEAGIASNVEQRAFLQTVKKGVVTTFDAANSALLRIIRLQQKDSTAARMGMEAYLTRFLNELVSNTEYLNQTFDTVQGALLEASSQMTSEASTEFEFIVQKWLGALSGVGLSEQTATSIAQALGYLGSGNIDALSGSPLQNLLIMASSKSGLDYSKLLKEGLDAETTDTLLRSLVDYMIEIGSTDNNVVRSQYAKTFGLTISDLTSVQQLSESLDTITGNMMDVSEMYSELNYQMGEIPLRLGMSEMISNLFSNAQFSLSEEIASNPMWAAMWRVTDMIQSATGGINIPTIGALGNFVDMNATVEQLMKLGLVGASSLGLIGDIVSGLNSTLLPSSMLMKLGISSSAMGVTRGTGLGAKGTGLSTSLSVFRGNTSGSDIYEQTLSRKTEGPKRQLEQQKQEEVSQNPILDYLNTKLDAHLINLINKVNSIDEKLSGEIKVDISESDIEGLSKGIGDRFPWIV